MIMRPGILKITLFLLTLCGSRAGAQQALSDTIDKKLAAFMHDPHHAGLSVGIIHNGDRYLFNYGTTNRTRRIRPDSHSIYEIASITKSFTGILLAHAVLEHRIDLNDAVSKYLQGRYPNLACQQHPIRIIDLADHTSGLPKFLPAYQKGLSPAKVIALYGKLSRAQFLAALAKVRIDKRPGSSFQYSNADAQLIGIVLENSYHTTYAKLVERYITRPNHMSDTKLNLSKADSARLVRGYDENGKPMPLLKQWDQLPAAGSLKSTTADMLNYIRLNINERDPAIRLSHRPAFNHSDEDDEAVGLFWFTKTSGGLRLVDHAGGSFGTTAYCLIYPDLKTGIICLANDASPNTETELRTLSKEVLKDVLTFRQAR